MKDLTHFQLNEIESKIRFCCGRDQDGACFASGKLGEHFIKMTYSESEFNKLDGPQRERHQELIYLAITEAIMYEVLKSAFDEINEVHREFCRDGKPDFPPAGRA